tara:strand:+ start:1297 stop:1611 length:315 start_codon:yes stop_codon:yes gene_type:complete
MKYLYKYEIQIKCPSKKSYQSHIDFMDKIIQISGKYNVLQKVKNVDLSNFLITWIVEFNSPKDQADAILKCMALLSKNNIVPGEMIYQTEISSSRKKTLEILEA